MSTYILVLALKCCGLVPIAEVDDKQACHDWESIDEYTSCIVLTDL